MADRRRRRRRASQDSEDDDDESGSGSDSGRSGSPATKSRGREPEPVEDVAGRVEPQKDAESECESEDGVGEAVLSDYDSADPEDNGSHSEGVEEEEEAEQYSDEETPAAVTQDQTPAAQVTTQGGGGQKEEQQEQEEEEEEGGGSKDNKVEEKGNLAGERQSGDGQESTDDPETTKVSVKPGQKLDDDEDRKNPAYIPRKGLFFEHDVRGHAQEEERPKGRNRKLWKDEGRWEHDRFREEEQAPKSREELIAIYGYDIRNGGGGGGGGAGERPYRHRRPRQSISPGRDKRWREAGSERPVRSWQSGGRGGTPPSSLHPSSFPATPPPSSSQRGGGGGVALRPPPPRGSNRPAHQNPTHLPPQSQYRNNESNTPQPHPRERSGGVKAAVEVSRAGRGGGGRGGSSVVIEDVVVIQGGVRDEDRGPATVTTTSSQHPPAVPRRQQQQEQRGAVTPTASDPALPAAASATTTNREASPPAERPPERKSYSLARRTRSRPADLGSKQTSMEEAAATAGNNANASPASTGGKSWTGGAGAGGAGDGPSQTGAGGAAGLADLDQDVARLSLSGQSWNQNPTSYIRSEMRGLPNPLHLPSAPPPFSGLEDLGVGSNRNKRYSSQRQRAVPEPPLHLGVMEGHYYDHMSYQGPIYAHGEGPAPIPPQGMLVQPEMHLPHPALHPHQSGGPIANPALYGGPPVSLSPGQPQQLLPPPFYPPPGVMTFQYPAMYPTPQVHSPAQAQVTYGGVTYYDTMQQQAQPKPSPPRRTSQPVTVKPPPPEVPFVSE